MSAERDNILDGFERHLRILRGLVPSSVRAYRRHVEEFRAWRAGNVMEDGPATRQDIEGYLQWCFCRNNSNSTRTTKVVALQNYFRYLVYSGVRPDDPTETLPRPRATRPLMQTFNQDQILKMFGAIDITREKGLRDAVFLILGAFAGFRVSEITAFKIEHIQDDGKDIDLIISRSKRGSSRTVYLWKAPAMFLRLLLEARLAAGARIGDPLLVGYYKNGRPQGNRRLSTKALDSLLKKIAARAGIRKPAIKTHMLRATHANDLQHVRGYRLPSIMQRLGWQNADTAFRYLVRRERIPTEYPSLHSYWIDFGRVWTNGDSTDDSSRAE